MRELIIDIAAFRKEWNTLPTDVQNAVLIDLATSLPKTDGKSSFEELSQAHAEWLRLLDYADTI